MASPSSKRRRGEKLLNGYLELGRLSVARSSVPASGRSPTSRCRKRPSNHAVLLQRVEIAGRQSKPLGINLGVVSAEQRRRRDWHVALRHFHGPTRDRDLAPHRVVDFDKDLSRPHARIANELASVEDRAARDARLT